MHKTQLFQHSPDSFPSQLKLKNLWANKALKTNPILCSRPEVKCFGIAQFSGFRCVRMRGNQKKHQQRQTIPINKTLEQEHFPNKFNYETCNESLFPSLPLTLSPT
jgi:hypothetical protein